METAFTVVGAGAVGLAAAAELAPMGPVLILERADGIGRGISSRNSEVVHAGIYYPPDSLRARLCIEGRRAIERWGGQGHFSYRRVGKLLVAQSEKERQALDDLSLLARRNGVDDLKPLTRSEIEHLEPCVQAHSGMLSPSTGILDSHGLMRFLLRRAEESGAQLVLGCEVTAFEPRIDGFLLTVRQDGDQQQIRTRALVNAAGLHADTLAEQAGLDLDALGLRMRWTRGEYFSLTPSCPIRIHRLVYPLPGAAGHLGIHVTVDLSGRLRLGPSLDQSKSGCDQPRREVYSQDDRLLDEFLRAARAYLPTLKREHLTPGGVGLRPHLLQSDGEPQDFYLREESDRDLPGLVNCIGIDSPGLTAAPAIGRHVAELLGA